jgi:hypothetical protein
MINTYTFSIDYCKCENSNVCNNHSHADDLHAANCDCDSCNITNYTNALREATAPNYNPYDMYESEWFQEPRVCRGCNNNDCVANNDADEFITRCRNIHLEGSNRMLNTNVPHACSCICYECIAESDDPLTPEPHSYTNPDICYECDIISSLYIQV